MAWHCWHHLGAQTSACKSHAHTQQDVDPVAICATTYKPPKINSWCVYPMLARVATETKRKWWLHRLNRHHFFHAQIWKFLSKNDVINGLAACCVRPRWCGKDTTLIISCKLLRGIDLEVLPCMVHFPVVTRTVLYNLQRGGPQAYLFSKWDGKCHPCLLQQK